MKYLPQLLMVLILVNVLYLMWGLYQPASRMPGVALVKESDLGPPLQVTADRDDAAAAGAGAVLGSGEPSSLEAVVGRACVTVGPFKVKTDADSAELAYADEGMNTSQRSGQGKIFIGHSVQVQEVPDRETGREMLAELQAAGLGDAFLVGNEEDGLAIALGIFGNETNAEKVELDARSAGFEVNTSPMTRDGVIYFVDIGLPPGRGAGAIVERYGEDKVMLREAATCPQ